RMGLPHRALREGAPAGARRLRPGCQRAARSERPPDAHDASHAQDVPDRSRRCRTRDLLARLPATAGHAERHQDPGTRRERQPRRRALSVSRSRSVSFLQVDGALADNTHAGPSYTSAARPQTRRRPMSTAENIRELAYRLWEERGRTDGHAQDDWLE